MYRIYPIAFSLILTCSVNAQKRSFDRLLSDSSMTNASVSFTIRDADDGNIIFDRNGDKSLSQASVMKLITSAAALELLGPDHVFTTMLCYTGKIKKGSGILEGNLIIRGGGDPALGSERFSDHYGNFMDKWVDEILNLGIKKIRGSVIADDSYFDYQPVPPKWNWEDMGNYYGAGVYGISIFDNTLKIHFQTGPEGTRPVINATEPMGSDISFINDLTAAGSADEGYVYSSPYAYSGWITGTIPVNRKDFILKASIPDPPQMAAALLCEKLRNKGIPVKLEPSTARKMPGISIRDCKMITRTDSPPLSAIISELDHESVNLYAEHLVKELGKVANGEGSTSSGIKVIKQFLDSTGVRSSGMFIEDGSGLSPQDAINSAGLTELLFRMRKNGKYFKEYLNSVPGPGKEGTIKNHFNDQVFESSLRAKSGSMLRVRSYAGFINAKSGENLIFSIIINNYSGPSSAIISHIEEILKETILDN